jgi:hypothetical protein
MKAQMGEKWLVGSLNIFDLTLPDVLANRKAQVGRAAMRIPDHLSSLEQSHLDVSI